MFGSQVLVPVVVWPMDHVCELLMGYRELIVFMLPRCALQRHLHLLNCAEAVNDSTVVQWTPITTVTAVLS